MGFMVDADDLVQEDEEGMKESVWSYRLDSGLD
jgi:hypothetical protein